MKNTKTFRQLEYECLLASKLLADEIGVEARREAINDALMKVYNLLKEKMEPFYNISTTIVPAADQETIRSENITVVVPEGGVLSSIDDTAKVIVRSASVFTVGSIISFSYLDMSDSSNGHFIARITTGGISATYEKLSGDVIPSIVFTGNVVGICHILKSLSVLTANTSGLYIQDIIGIYDSVARINQKTFDRKIDPSIFREFSRIYENDKRIAYYWHGDAIDFAVGASATPLGVVTMEYRCKPPLYTEATENNEIMIPPEYNQSLKEEVIAAYIQRAKGLSTQIKPAYAEALAGGGA